MGLKPVLFNTADDDGNPVYHTNVVLCIGTKFALIGIDMIPNQTERHNLLQHLEQAGKTIIHLSNKQIIEFAGNAIELTDKTDCYLAMSQRGVNSLKVSQRCRIENHATIVSTPLPTVELSGVSMRCMIVGIHLRCI